MSNSAIAADQRRLLVERVTQSRYIAKSARLHDLMLYLCRRVIEDGMEEIHEQEVGHGVFGRPHEYDTTADNIVRVHASTLRKRLEQYFAEEGRDEPLTIELPKGNYAPVFRTRDVSPPLAPLTGILPVSAVSQEASQEAPPIRLKPADRRFLIAAALAAIFASSTILLWVRPRASDGRAAESVPPAVREFWGAVFAPRRAADVVLDDAALGLYQELDGRPIALSEYFDRSYLRRLAQKGAGNPLDPDLASTIMLKRQSSYANVGLLGPLSHTALALNSDFNLHFARDYAFRELKANSAVLLGNSHSNPWIEPFENRLGIRWAYDRAAGNSYPVDSWAPADQAERYRPGGEHPDGYCSVALLPNLGGAGSVIVISGTGGAATGAAGAFLMDGSRMAELRAKLPAGGNRQFPYFEALLRIPSRSRLPKDVQLAICRPARLQ